MKTLVNRSWITYLLVFLLITNLAALGTIIYFLSVQDNKPLLPPEQHAEMKGGDIIKSLNLTPAQNTKFIESRNRFQEKTRPVLNDVQLIRKEIIDKLDTDNPDTVKLYKLADELGKKNALLKKQAMRHFIEIRRECDPEQKIKVRALCRHLFRIGEHDGRVKQHKHGLNRGERIGGKECVNEKFNDSLNNNFNR